MSWTSACGFLVSFYIFHAYSSNTEPGSNEKKYQSYAVLKNSVIPAIKTTDSEFIKKTLEQYFEQVKK